MVGFWCRICEPAYLENTLHRLGTFKHRRLRIIPVFVKHGFPELSHLMGHAPSSGHHPACCAAGCVQWENYLKNL